MESTVRYLRADLENELWKSGSVELQTPRNPGEPVVTSGPWAQFMSSNVAAGLLCRLHPHTAQREALKHNNSEVKNNGNDH